MKLSLNASSYGDFFRRKNSLCFTFYFGNEGPMLKRYNNAPNTVLENDAKTRRQSIILSSLGFVISYSTLVITIGTLQIDIV